MEYYNIDFFDALRYMVLGYWCECENGIYYTLSDYMFMCKSDLDDDDHFYIEKPFKDAFDSLRNSRFRRKEN